MMQTINQGGSPRAENLANTRITTCHSVGTSTAAAAIPPAFLIDQNGKKHFRSACKARGVADDHDAQTAYLMVPEDATHGHVLKCSHPTCIRTGRAFRYCAVCRMPVTKRNFHRRHNHGLVGYDEDGRPILPEDDEEKPTSFTDRSKTAASRPFAAVEAIPCSSDDLVHQAAPTKRPRHVRAVSYETLPRSTLTDTEFGPMVYPVSDGSEDSDFDGPRQSPCESLRKEEMDWLKLFHQRPVDSPNNPTAMSTWFSSVMGVAFSNGEVDNKEDPNNKEAASTGSVAKNATAEETMIDLDDLDIADMDALFGDQFVPAFDENWNSTYSV